MTISNIMTTDFSAYSITESLLLVALTLLAAALVYSIFKRRG